MKNANPKLLIQYTANQRAWIERQARKNEMTVAEFMRRMVDKQRVMR